MPSVSFAFGLFTDRGLEGVLTIGKPASWNLCVGLCGEEFKAQVYELNRLVLNDGLPKNTASMFVGRALKMLRGKDLAIVSYADSGMGHFGYVYQATNFLYTGATSKRTEQYSVGGKHSRHSTEGFEHLRVTRTSKHRYVYFTDRNSVLRKALKYPVLPYPKGEGLRYELGVKQKREVTNKITGEVFWE